MGDNAKDKDDHVRLQKKLSPMCKRSRGQVGEKQFWLQGPGGEAGGLPEEGSRGKTVQQARREEEKQFLFEQ